MADLGAIEFLQFGRDSLEESVTQEARESATERSRFARERSAPTPPRVVLLGEPIEP